jgi:CspA family cold shock protein
VRAAILERHTGYVARFDEAKGFGFIALDGQRDVFVHHSDVSAGEYLVAGDVVSFEIVQDDRGPRAVRVEVREQPRQKGQVKWFDQKRRFGYITMSDGKDIFVHRNDLEDVSILKPRQRVSFQVGQSPKGPKAVRVRIESEE